MIDDRWIVRNPRTASRIWGKVTIVILLPDKSNPSEKIFEFGLDAGYIWQLLRRKSKAKDIIMNFSKNKGISSNQARQKVLTFLVKLNKERLICFLK
jgi:hypothetical protein